MKALCKSKGIPWLAVFSKKDFKGPKAVTLTRVVLTDAEFSKRGSGSQVISLQLPARELICTLEKLIPAKKSSSTHAHTHSRVDSHHMDTSILTQETSQLQETLPQLYRSDPINTKLDLIVVRGLVSAIYKNHLKYWFKTVKLSSGDLAAANHLARALKKVQTPTVIFSEKDMKVDVYSP